MAQPSKPSRGLNLLPQLFKGVKHSAFLGSYYWDENHRHIVGTSARDPKLGSEFLLTELVSHQPQVPTPTLTFVPDVVEVSESTRILVFHAKD